MVVWSQNERKKKIVAEFKFVGGTSQHVTIYGVSEGLPTQTNKRKMAWEQGYNFSSNLVLRSYTLELKLQNVSFLLIKYEM